MVNYDFDFQLDDFMLFCRTQQLRPKTMASYEQTLRLFQRWLKEELQIEKVNRKAKEYISDEDFKKLISRFDKSYFSEHRDYAMIYLMLDSGMRLGECSELLCEDISLHNRKIFLRAEITKGRKDRTVYFSEKTETLLRRWLQFKDRYCESGYFFPVKHGDHHVAVSSFECNFKRYLQRAGLNENISPHCLRNNYAKRCLINGIDIYTLSRLLGHSSVEVTEKAYLDLTDEDLGKKYANYSPISSIK